jgi:hypothetical protein
MEDPTPWTSSRPVNTPAALLIGRQPDSGMGGKWLTHEVLAQVAVEAASWTGYAGESAGQFVFVLDRRALS